MAILPAVPGLSVHVQIAGERVVEYPDEERADVTEPRVSHCYIQSVGGEEFAIETTVTPEFPLKNGHDGLSIHTDIDGSKLLLRSNLIQLEAVRRTTQTRLCSQVYTASEGPWSVKISNLVFIPVVTNDGQLDPETCDPHVSKSLGTIAVKILTSISTGSSSALTVSKVDRKASIGVHEKLLKGKDLAHGSSFSSTQTVANPGINHNTDHTHIATFYFHYRSYEALQRQLIIPRSPSPSPTPGNGDQLEDLTEEQIRNLARQRLDDVRAKAENSRAIKRERDSPPRALRPLKLVKLADGTEAIDLSDD